MKKEQEHLFKSSSKETQAYLSDIKRDKHNLSLLLKKEPYQYVQINHRYQDSQKVNQCLKCICMNEFKQAICHCCFIRDETQRTIMINSLQTIFGFATAKNQQIEQLNASHQTIRERNAAIEGVMEGLYKIIENQKVQSKKEETVLDKANELMAIWRSIMPDLRALQEFRDIIKQKQPESKQQTKQIDEEIKNKLKQIRSLNGSRQQDSSSLTTTNRELEEQMKSLDSQICMMNGDLQKAFSDYKKNVETLNKEKDRLKQQVKNLENEMKTLYEKNKESVNDFERTIVDLNREIKTWKNENDRPNKRVASQKQEKMTMRSDYKSGRERADTQQQEQIGRLKEQISELQGGYKEQQEKQEQIGRLQEQIRQLQAYCQEYIGRIQKQISTLKVDQKQVQQQIGRLNEQIRKFSAKLEAGEKQKQKQEQKFEGQIRELSEKLYAKQKQQQQQLGGLKEYIRELQGYYKETQEQIRKLTDKIRKLKAGSKEKQEQIRRRKAQVIGLSQKLAAAEGQRSRLAGELQGVYSKFGATDKQQFHHRYSQIMQEYTQVWAILFDISSTLNIPSSQSQPELARMHSLGSQLSSIQHQISAMAEELQRKNVPTSSASTNTCPTYSENMETQTEGQQKPEHELSMKHFGGNLMDGFSYDENNDSGVGFEQERKFLVKCIEDVEKRPIRVTRLLFRFDPLTETKNFHKFIDGRPQWVLLIKLTNNYMIAGYSNLALLPGLANQGSGFLASLTNAVCLFRDERIMESKLVVYDSYFIIFGSSEIRLKLSERKVVSNLGAAHHSFKTNEKSAKILLGIEQKEMDVEQFEIHQVYF